MKNKILAARVSSWPSFKIRKYSKERGEPLGLILTDAIQIYLNLMDIPEKKIEEWLKEYHEGGSDAVD